MTQMFSEQYKIGLTDEGLETLVTMSRVHHAIFDLLRGQAVSVEFFTNEHSPIEFMDCDDIKIYKFPYAKLTLIKSDDKFNVTLNLSSASRAEVVLGVKSLTDIIKFLDSDKQGLTFLYDNDSIPSYCL